MLKTALIHALPTPDRKPRQERGCMSSRCKGLVNTGLWVPHHSMPTSTGRQQLCTCRTHPVSARHWPSSPRGR
eukprot:356902-Chlamydomonas_euryale.AAC.19